MAGRHRRMIWDVTKVVDAVCTHNLPALQPEPALLGKQLNMQQQIAKAKNSLEEARRPDDKKAVGFWRKRTDRI